jgi:hypothetical protein
MATRNGLGDLVSDYGQLRTVPAFLSIAFAVASLFAFGGIASVELVWLNYTLTQNHAVLLSLAVYAVAFMSSETNRFENYTSGEQAMILAGPGIMLAQKFLPAVQDFISTNQPSAGVFAFVVAFLGWAVMVR